jgi:hypothetical protein
MNRRVFTQALAASAVAAQEKRVSVALLTHAAGPHLGAYLEGLAKAEEVSAVYLSDPDTQVKPAARQALGTSWRLPSALRMNYSPNTSPPWRW